MRTILHCCFMFVLGCSRPVAQRDIKPENPRYCFSAIGLADGELESGTVCTERVATCRKLQQGAVKYGRLLALRGVGQCEVRG